MKTVQAIIEKRGGLEALKENYIRIENDPWMRLVIEYIGKGPRKAPLISVAHYGEQNGDAMRDPEMTFEIATDGLSGWRFLPVSYRNDYVGIVQEGEMGAIFVDADGVVMTRPKLIKDLTSFARTWDRNIEAQGFLKAA